MPGGVGFELEEEVEVFVDLAVAGGFVADEEGEIALGVEVVHGGSVGDGGRLRLVRVGGIGEGDVAWVDGSLLAEGDALEAEDAESDLFDEEALDLVLGREGLVEAEEELLEAFGLSRDDFGEDAVFDGVSAASLFAGFGFGAGGVLGVGLVSVVVVVVGKGRKGHEGHEGL